MLQDLLTELQDLFKELQDLFTELQDLFTELPLISMLCLTYRFYKLGFFHALIYSLKS